MEKSLSGSSKRLHSLKANYAGIGDCVEILTSGLLPCGWAFNNSICRSPDGRLLMAYRKEDRDAGKFAEIAIVELTEDFDPKLETNTLVDIPRPRPFTGLFEDPRLVTVGNKLFLGFIAATATSQAHTACQGITELDLETLQPKSPVYPKIGNNHNHASVGNRHKLGEKNWTFYDNNGQLGAIYMLQPLVDYPDILGNVGHVVHGGQKRSWGFGHVSGSTPLIKFSETELLGVFHSFKPVNHPPYRHYFTGFFVVDTVTHEIKAISRAPVMVAQPDKARDVRPPGWTPNAIFPCGLVEMPEGAFAVSLGWQDCRCLIKTFSRAEIEASIDRAEVPHRMVTKISSRHTDQFVRTEMPKFTITLGKHEIQCTSWHRLLKITKDLGFTEEETEAAVLKVIPKECTTTKWVKAQ